jgi:hypothetical protein
MVPTKAKATANARHGTGEEKYRIAALRGVMSIR